MVGRLVQQQHVRSSDHGLGNRQPLPPATTQGVRDHVHILEPGATQRLAQLLLTLALGNVRSGKRPRQHLARGLAFGKLGNLFYIPHAPPLARDDLARIGLHLTRQHSQQCGLSSTIRPNQADTVTIGNRKSNVLK